MSIPEESQNIGEDVENLEGAEDTTESKFEPEGTFDGVASEAIKGGKGS
jgi:hypothetical protein